MFELQKAIVTTLMALGSGLLMIASGVLIWIAILIAGRVFDGYMAIFSTVLIEVEGVGGENAGSAIGLADMMAFSFLPTVSAENKTAQA